MSVNWKFLEATTKETVNEFLQDRAMRLAAATAYYAIFSIGPLLVLTVGLAGVVFGEDAVRREVVQQMRSYVGEKSASMISSMMSARHTGGSIWATVLGAAALVIGATGAFGQLQDSLNTIWGVTPKPGKNIGAFIRDRFFSMAMVLGVGFVLLVSMALSAFVVAFAGYIGAKVALPAWLVPFLNDAMNFAVISLLFAMIFKVLPDVKIRWRDVGIGAVGTAFLFTVGKFLLGVYLAREATTSAYGAGSAFVVILLYIYYASVILYFGAEFTQVYARYRGARFEPSKYAVRITDFERAEQGMPRQEQIEAAARRRNHPPQLSAKAAAPNSSRCPRPTAFGLFGACLLRGSRDGPGLGPKGAPKESPRLAATRLSLKPSICPALRMPQRPVDGPKPPPN
ncbi:MAG TPA: YihY/virulence factor BrkB family protein [Verrucomicrobiae bacterium]|nr:YihY/virulence factor BrkB family protein [Verrucomicrobiae bacterium]